VKDLDVEHIGKPAFLGAHSIGALVLHIGEAEWWWMKCNVAGHQLTPEDAQAPYWDVLENPEGFANKGYTAEFCLQEVDKIRNQTRDILFGHLDKDLDQTVNVKRQGEIHGNQYPLDSSSSDRSRGATQRADIDVEEVDG
jgi:hypothetical protein